MAIDKDGVKSACMSCIRGHRVKRCQHHDRKLVPITKPGRQISQCSHCRDLRLTHKTHVKCNCAIAQVPNPLNGCLCEVIKSCTCVSHHLQDIDTESTMESPTVSELSSPSPSVNNSIFLNTKDIHEFLTNDINELLSICQN